MAPTKGIPNRRKSIAVPSDQNQPIHGTRKRRAHSIAPGERLSPLSKARRSLAPRKSILKASINFNVAGDDLEDGAESGEVTKDFQTDIRDNTTQRAIFARRVSFAETAHVRLFNKDNNNTNSTASPQSSPAHEPAPSNVVNDENAYPGATAGRRRSSMRRSVAFSDNGEESMDMDMDDTALGPDAFLFTDGDPANADDMYDEDEEYEGGDDDDMEMTEAISQNIMRKRSLSLGVQPRRPLSNVRDSINPRDIQNPSSEPDQSYTEDSTTSTSTSAVEYTVPLVKPPAPPTDAWLALRSVTHSGDTPYEAPPSDEDEDGAQGMDLTDAVQRLMAVRQSLDLGRGANEESGSQGEEDSFASTNDSFEDGDDGNRTVNVTGLLNRASLGAATDADSTMELTGDYGEGIVHQAGRLSIAPVQHQRPEREASTRQAIFSAPPQRSPSKGNKSPARPLPHATVPQPFNFSFTPQDQPHKPASPSKSQPTKIPTPVFSANPTTRSSPKKRPAPDENHEEPENRPSPAKKVAVAGRWPDSFTPQAVPAAKPTPASASKSPARLSPGKKAPFLTHQAPSDAKKPTGSVRRPSGYFAQRKSLGAGALLPPENGSVAKRSPKKAGRMSVGHSDRHVKFDVNAEREKVQQEKLAQDQESRRSSTPPPAQRGSLVNEHDDMEIEVINPAAQWREDVQEQSFTEDGPPISIEQFFNMTGIRFMDEITAPRRSTIHPSALRPRRHSSPSSTSDTDIALAEYVTAMSVDVPQLELYTYVSRDLEAWIERSKGIFREAEAEAEKITPELFREFVDAGEDGQAELLHQLKLIKANTHGNAKSEWYDWKFQWVEQLYGKADKGFIDLENDAKALEIITSQAQALVPSLREGYQRVLRELEEEKALVAEIENSDQQYLNELKTTIAEQNAELEAFRADVAEGNAKLERLQEKMQELAVQKQDANHAIEEAQRLIHIQKNSTRAEVFRLKDELESLEDLHLWRAVKIQPDLLEFIYASTYRVSIPCVKFKPLVEQLDIGRLDDVKTRAKDAFPQLTDLMLRMAKHRVVQEHGVANIRTIVQLLSDYWSSCSQLRLQLKLVSAKYPLFIDTLPSKQNNNTGFKATASVIFPSVQAKALLSFILDMETISSWPRSIGSTRCEVEVAYGTIDQNTLLEAMNSRLEQATPAANHACLLDACMEAMDHYV